MEEIKNGELNRKVDVIQKKESIKKFKKTENGL